MNILDQIVAHKHQEIQLKKSIIKVKQLEASTLFDRETISLSHKLKQSNSGIIAEFKRKSPSKSLINDTLNVFDAAEIYEASGVCGMSVLTDTKFFGGSLDDLILARASCQIPLLRKEFILDPYQIIEAKAHGADVILLIAAILSPSQIKDYAQLAHQLQLEVLLEVHNEAELHACLTSHIDMVGVNNRNLKTFEVNLETSRKLSALIPDDFIKVSESGISDITSIKSLQTYGFQGFLIGENFMKSDNIAHTTQNFVKALNQ